MIKLIAADLDGTLFQNGNHTIPDYLFPLIKEYTRQGGLFTVASGRQYANLQRLFYPVKDEIAYICENGCLVFYHDQMLFHAQMEHSLGRDVLVAMKSIPHCEILLSGVHTCYIEPKESTFLPYIRDHVQNNTTVVSDIFSVREPYFKISAYSSLGVDSFEAQLKDSFGDLLNVVTSGNRWIDIMPKGIHKGSAAQILTKELNIHLNDAMAIGDHYNDYEILSLVGHPACVDNAQPEIKALCRYQESSGLNLLSKFLKDPY